MKIKAFIRSFHPDFSYLNWGWCHRPPAGDAKTESVNGRLIWNPVIWFMTGTKKWGSDIVNEAHLRPTWTDITDDCDRRLWCRPIWAMWQPWCDHQISGILKSKIHWVWRFHSHSEGCHSHRAWCQFIRSGPAEHHTLHGCQNLSLQNCFKWLTQTHWKWND